MSLAPPNVLQDARKQWSAAFSRCYAYTMRSLAFPTNYKRSSGGKGRRSSDGFRGPDSILSVLSSGRPLPKSPSLQMLEVDLDVIELEREERQWWAGRFQQVLGELSSRDEASATPQSLENVQERQNPWEVFTDVVPLSGRPSSGSKQATVKESKSKFLKFKR